MDTNDQDKLRLILTGFESTIVDCQLRIKSAMARQNMYPTEATAEEVKAQTGLLNSIQERKRRAQNLLRQAQTDLPDDHILLGLSAAGVW